MKTFAAIFLTGLFCCGCDKKIPIMWQYKTVEIDNSSHAETPGEVGSQAWSDAYHQSKSDAGYFRFYSTNRDNDLSALGDDGWELVAAIPQTETVPDGETLDSPLPKTYRAFSNTRTAKVILIFKRPVN
jgi:hypothetical protein